MINVVARDIILNALLVFVALVVILLLLVNPPSAENDTTPPGNLVVTVVWNDGPHDLDLWIFGPEEERPIGFSNKTGKNWSLLRDDLGDRNDSLPANLEHAYSRAVVAGHYVFNAFCYTCRAGPVTATFELRVANMEGGGGSTVILTTTVTLTQGQELTIVQLDLTAAGTIVPGSAHSVFTPLHKAWK